MSGERPIAFSAPDITDGDIAAVTRVLRSGWLTTGDECLGFEEELGGYLGIDHVVTMSSCTAALETAMAFLDLPAGARVGVPTWTFVSSALAPVHSGAVPVLLDIEEDSLNLSVASLDAALAEGLDALVVVHFGGVPAADEIRDRCAAFDVPVVEDCAHALGASDSRGLLAGRGTAGACFSFYATKNLTSGEGGALATDDERLADFARSFRLHGLSRDAWARYRPGAGSGYDLMAPGIKGNLSDVLAALARSHLRRYAESQGRRRALVDRYRSNLAAVQGLRCVPGEMSDGAADHLMVVVLPEGAPRAQVAARLNDAGVATSVHFQPLHQFDWFRKNTSTGPGGTPVADDLAMRVLSLPLHPGLHVADVDRICESLSDALDR